MQTAYGESIICGSSSKSTEHTDRFTKDAKTRSSETTVKLWERAMDLFRQQRYEDSKSLYETYIKANPNNFEAIGQYVSYRTLVLVRKFAAQQKN